MQFLPDSLHEKQHRIRHYALPYACEEEEKGPLAMELGILWQGVFEIYRSRTPRRTERTQVCRASVKPF